MKSLRFGIGVILSTSLLYASSAEVFAKENKDDVSKLWEKAALYGNEVDLRAVVEDGKVTTQGSTTISTVGTGSTYIYASEASLTSGVKAITPQGYPVSEVKAVGKTTSKVTLSTHGVTTTLMLNGTSIGSNKDSGVGKSTDTATVYHYPNSVSSGWEYRATSHHTLSTSTNTFVADTGDSMKF
ncbi:hypothetical protein [Anoxybacteroides tepidamans]|uniref:hypothetical protein n=1 Tax=Anoxybacteroides tepidamans TaxID=265948 RepID=UPI00047F58D9|nr:hypothetical protein [Anoxybacillus tepidamans]